MGQPLKELARYYGLDSFAVVMFEDRRDVLGGSLSDSIPAYPHAGQLARQQLALLVGAEGG